MTGSHEKSVGEASAVDRFFVADRDVGWLAGSASLAATQVSAGTFVGAVGIHYAVGVSFLLAWAGIWLGWLVSIAFVAPRFRAFGGVTVPEFLAVRLGGPSGDERVRALAATLVAVIYLVYTSAQYVAGGVLLKSAFGVPSVVAMATIALLALVYTALGGMRASVVTDVLLVVLMLVGLVAATAVALARVGGIVALHAEVVATDPALLGLNMPIPDLLGFALAFGLALIVAPYEVSRVYAMRDRQTVRKAIVGSLGLQVVIAACIVVLGLVARVTFPELSTPDAAAVRLVEAMFGPVIGAAFILGVIAAILSTVDSVLLVSASAIAYDLYELVLRTDEGDGDRTDPTSSADRPEGVDRLRRSPFETADNRRTLRIARATTVVSALLPLALAVNKGLLGGLVQPIVALYAALIAGTLFAPVILGLYWDGVTTTGGIAGMVAGFVAVIGWHVAATVVGTLPPGFATVPPVVIGTVCSTLGTVVPSFFS